MAHASVVDLDSDLVGLGRSNFDIFDAELLAGLPGYGSLASDGLLRDMTVNLSVSEQNEQASFGGGEFAAGVIALYTPFQRCRPLRMLSAPG